MQGGFETGEKTDRVYKRPPHELKCVVNIVPHISKTIYLIFTNPLNDFNLIHIVLHGETECCLHDYATTGLKD